MMIPEYATPIVTHKEEICKPLPDTIESEVHDLDS